MTLTAKGKKILAGMRGFYGQRKGTQVFYASKNAKRIKGVGMASYRCSICYKKGHNKRAHNRKNPSGIRLMHALWTADSGLSIHRYIKRHRRSNRRRII